jgi:HTH-type transcriptional regulator, sugar sensing transcriptional regulator
MTNNSPEATVTALGFTETEAAVYCALLRGGAATGYRLAQAIGKAPANVYQTLASLAQRGAVMIDDGETRIYRATEPRELLASLESAFEASRRKAETALAKLRTPPDDDRIYQLKTPAQVYERAQAMIAEAKEVLLFDLFPEPLSRLTPALLKAHNRGVRLAGLVYADVTLPFPIAAAPRGTVLHRWPGLQLSIVVDASEHLLALLSGDGSRVLHGVCSDSAYLACLQHSGLGAEIRLSALAPDAHDRLGDIALLRAYPPGLRSLIGPRERAKTKRGTA